MLYLNDNIDSSSGRGGRGRGRFVPIPRALQHTASSGIKYVLGSIKVIDGYSWLVTLLNVMKHM